MMKFQLIFLSIIFSHCLEHVSSNNSTMDNAKLSEIINYVKQLKHDKLIRLNHFLHELSTEEAIQPGIPPPEDEGSQSTPTVNDKNMGPSNNSATITTTDKIRTYFPTSPGSNSSFPTTDNTTKSRIGITKAAVINEQTTSEVPEVFTSSSTTTFFKEKATHPSPFSVTSTTYVRTNSFASEVTDIFAQAIITSLTTTATTTTTEKSINDPNSSSLSEPKTTANSLTAEKSTVSNKPSPTSTKRVLPTSNTTATPQKGQKTTSQNEIIKEKPTAKDHSSPTTVNKRQDKSRGDGLLGYKSNFPAIFMIILLLIVVIYFGYHNRNKIQRFIKTGYSSRNHGSSGYVKVKVEDEINLPHDANRHYVY